MRNLGMAVVVCGLVAGCGGTRPRSAQVAPACTAADRATLDDLRRALHDSARLSALERATADTAATAALWRVLADTASIAKLRGLAADSAWGAQHRAQVDELVAELAQLGRC